MNNSQTRIQEFQEYSKNHSIITVTGHGSLITTGNIEFKVPDDVYIVFISRPGYWLSLRLLAQSRMMNMLKSETKMRQLIMGKLSKTNTPDIITKSHWNWKNHIYPPKTLCPNMYFQIYDKSGTSVGNWYDNMCGIIYLENSGSRFGHNQNVNLKDIVLQAPKKGVFFVFGCRGDPNSNMKPSFNKYGKFGEPQNYPIPYSLPTSVINKHEKLVKTLMVKRVRTPALSLRKSKTESRPTKRRKTLSIAEIIAGERRQKTLARRRTLVAAARRRASTLKRNRSASPGSNEPSSKRRKT